jgi:hypothetical protein
MFFSSRRASLTELSLVKKKKKIELLLHTKQLYLYGLEKYWVKHVVLAVEKGWNVRDILLFFLFFSFFILFFSLYTTSHGRVEVKRHGRKDHALCAFLSPPFSLLLCPARPSHSPHDSTSMLPSPPASPAPLPSPDVACSDIVFTAGSAPRPHTTHCLSTQTSH